MTKSSLIENTLDPPEIEAPLDLDVRWQCVQRTLACAHFAKAPLLSKFLFYICDRSLQGRNTEITEQQIGVQVFARPQSYNPAEDNIVRNYARQLRKRLDEHFHSDGQQEPFHIQVPRGGYIPVFVLRSLMTTCPSAFLTDKDADAPGMPLAPALAVESSYSSTRHVSAGRFMLLLLYTVMLLALGAALGTYRIRKMAQTTVRNIPAHALWTQLFSPDADTFIIPADSGLGVLQNLLHTRIPLADYIDGRSLSAALTGMDAAAANDLRTQRYTSIVDLDIASRLTQLPEIVQPRVFLRFARDLRMDDLKRGNAILLGSVYSNPWIEVFQKKLNFRFDYEPRLHGSWIRNEHPRPGEQSSYENGWDHPSHQTFAVIAFLPNLTGTGHVLLVQGLDVAGTQAAAEMLLHDSAMGRILRKATLKDGSIGRFELLLQTTSIGSNASSSRLVAARYEAEEP